MPSDGQPPSSPHPLLFGTFRRRLPRRHLQERARELQQRVAKGREFSCLLTNDEEIRTLNKQFRKKDKTTDVLSFPALPESGDLGDIAISVDRAAAQAKEHGHTVEQEIEILILHGLLHLLGYDHETDEGRMARAERRWRKTLGLPVGLIERVHA